MAFTVAIVGRPNVGKSTLFNRLVGKRLALVDDTPGVTRDRREGEARLGDLVFTAIDTAGFEEAAAGTLARRMRDQTERAVEAADVTLLLYDARAGVTPLDEDFARWLRTKRRPVLVVANKCEGREGQPGLAEGYGLGLGDPIALSAEHGEGLSALYDALSPFAPAEELSAEEPTGEEPEPEAEAQAEADADADAEAEAKIARPLQLAVVGRPNVGKSTLVNRMIGEERLLTGPEAGITRDAIAVDWTWRGRSLRLIDTAGLRRRSKVETKLEKLSAADALRAVRFAEVVVLVIDAREMLEKQDLTIARFIVEEGRALVIAANKWDLVEDRAAAMRLLRDRLEASLPQVRGVPVVTLSALKDRAFDKVMEAVVAAHDAWNRRVPTPALNRWLAEATGAHAPPAVAGRPVRLRYMTQAKARPPTFALFASRPEGVPDSYLRYLVNGLREAFDLPGTPIRVHLRKGRNPYAGK